MTCQDVLQRFAETAQQMETICDLHRVGRAQACSFGIGPGTIAADHFRRGMVAQHSVRVLDWRSG